MLMYEFHNNCMQPNYRSNVKLPYMGRNSFVYGIETEELYKDIA